MTLTLQHAPVLFLPPPLPPTTIDADGRSLLLLLHGRRQRHHIRSRKHKGNFFFKEKNRVEEEDISPSLSPHSDAKLPRSEKGKAKLWGLAFLSSSSSAKKKEQDWPLRSLDKLYRQKREHEKCWRRWLWDSYWKYWTPPKITNEKGIGCGNLQVGRGWVERENDFKARFILIRSASSSITSFRNCCCWPC